MKLQIHALRFCEDDAERAKKRVFNSNPAEIPIAEGSEVVITAKEGKVNILIDGQPSNMPVFLGPWDHTAVALVVDEIPEA